MSLQDAAEVARRCLCLELLFQRHVLEIDDEDTLAARDEVRRVWASRLADLGVADAIDEEEQALLERPVGELTEDERDDVYGRASGSLVLLWALGRLQARPSYVSADVMADTLAEHGLLGTGSISQARQNAETATLRPEAELRDGLAAYVRIRGKAREITDPDKIVAEVNVDQLSWVLEG